MLRKFAWPVVFLVACSPTGCNLVGPPAVHGARLPYNEAINRSWNEQLLLNLVRLKFRDTPFFLEMSSLSTQYSLSSSIGAAQRFDWNSPGGDPFTGTAGLNFSERPTVTYSPLQGENFSKRLLTPMPLEYILMLAYSGWNVEQVLRCCAQGINGVFNAATAAGPTPQTAPSYKEFNRVAELLGKLQDSARLRLDADDPETEGVSRKIYLNIDGGHAGEEDPVIGELKRLLRLNPETSRYRLTQNPAPRDRNELAIVPRSLLAAMFYLSQSVDVLQEDRDAGRITQTVAADGSPFDWRLLHDGLFRIHASPSRPDDAYVAVAYRGSWFFLRDSDLDSKSTFVLLSFLFSLQSGDSRGFAPALTLPL